LYSSYINNVMMGTENLPFCNFNLPLKYVNLKFHKYSPNVVFRDCALKFFAFS